MTQITKEAILAALGTVQEPELHQDLVTLNMIRELEIQGDKVSFTVMLTTPACPLRGKIESEARQAVMSVGGVKEVTIKMDSDVPNDGRMRGLVNMPIRNAIAVGSGKGGVGKSMVSRLLAQYFIDHQIPFVGFDTDRSHGSLLRFYTEFASAALTDSYEALDRIVEAAIEQPGRRVLVDLAAQTQEPLVKWMDESGVLDMADLSGIGMNYWHVMDAGRDSVDLLKRLLDRFGQRVRYVLVKNQLRGDDFGILERSGELERALGLGARVMDLKKLHDAVVQKIDARNSSFWAARNGGAIDGPGLGLMERQRLKLWMNHAYDAFARIAP